MQSIGGKQEGIKKILARDALVIPPRTGGWIVYFFATGDVPCYFRV
jgi:hypothetical protein